MKDVIRFIVFIIILTILLPIWIMTIPWMIAYILILLCQETKDMCTMGRRIVTSDGEIRIDPDQSSHSVDFFVWIIPVMKCIDEIVFEYLKQVDNKKESRIMNYSYLLTILIIIVFLMSALVFRASTCSSSCPNSTYINPSYHGDVHYVDD